MLHRTQKRRRLLQRRLSSPKVKSGEQQGDGESSKVDTDNEGKQSRKRKDLNTGKGEGAGHGEAKAKARRKEKVKNDEERCDEGEDEKPAGSAPKKNRKTAEIDPNVLEEACCTCCRGNGCHV